MHNTINTSNHTTQNNVMNMTTSTVTPRYAIDTCATLVEISISTWTARKLDRSVSDEVIASKHAGSKDAARVNKNLLAGRSELERILTHVSATRAYVYDNTLPWSDNGQRLLPRAMFMKFDAEMQRREEEFVRLVSEFVTLYPTLITAQAMELGAMFKRDDYPAPYEIARKFAWSLDYIPVPTAGDFRIDVGNDAANELQRKLIERSDQRVEQALDTLIVGMREHLERMAKQLTVEVGPDGKQRKGKLYDSLLDGGVDLCDRIASLNLLGDARIEALRQDMHRVVTSVTMDDLRKTDGAREETRAKVDELLSKFNF
jgi:hypothetical protein